MDMTKMSNDVTARATLNHFLRMTWRMSTVPNVH